MKTRSKNAWTKFKLGYSVTIKPDFHDTYLHMQKFKQIFLIKLSKCSRSLPIQVPNEVKDVAIEQSKVI